MVQFENINLERYITKKEALDFSPENVSFFHHFFQHAQQKNLVKSTDT